MPHLSSLLLCFEILVNNSIVNSSILNKGSSSMSLNKAYECNSAWATCPVDILIIVFRKLDTVSLINCIDVNKFWRNVVYYYCEHVNLWKTMVDNEGATFTEKSVMEWQDQFVCAHQWRNIKHVTVCLHHNYKLNYIKNICVVGDHLVVVSDIAVKYFHIDTFDLLKTIEVSCLKYEETLSLIAELSLPLNCITRCNVLKLTNKLYKNNDPETMKKIVVLDVSLFKVHLNSCYVVDIKNVLWVYTANDNNWDSKALAKYYGNKDSMCSIHIHKNNVYILLKRGDVLLVDLECKKFEKIFHFNIPLHSLDPKLFMFHTFSVLFEVPNYKEISIHFHKETKIIAMACVGVTCAMEHGQTLLLGYEDGKIEVYLIKKLLEQSTTPELQFNLQNYQNSPMPSCKITAIDVYEDNRAHHLFVTTVSDVYELLLYY